MKPDAADESNRPCVEWSVRVWPGSCHSAVATTGGCADRRSCGILPLRQKRKTPLAGPFGGIDSAHPCAFPARALARALDGAWQCHENSRLAPSAAAPSTSAILPMCRTEGSHQVLPLRQKRKTPLAGRFAFLAEREGFEPRYAIHVRLISSQVHSTALPPLRRGSGEDDLAAGPPSYEAGLRITRRVHWPPPNPSCCVPPCQKSPLPSPSANCSTRSPSSRSSPSACPIREARQRAQRALGLGADPGWRIRRRGTTSCACARTSRR